MTQLQKEMTFIAEGRVSHVYSLTDRRVLKLLHSSVPKKKVEEEFELCRIVADSGIRTPQAIELVEIDDRTGIIFEWAGSEDLLNAKLNNPLNIPSAGRLMAEAHLGVISREAEKLPNIKDAMIRMMQELPEEAIQKSQYQLFESYVDTLPDGANICHLDFHPGNIMLEGDDYQVIDWAEVVKGAPEADVAMTCLILAMAETSPGTSLLLKILIPIFRKLFERTYRKSLLASAKSITEDKIRKWLLATAIIRMGLWHLESEKEFLSGLIQSELTNLAR